MKEAQGKPFSIALELFVQHVTMQVIKNQICYHNHGVEIIFVSLIEASKADLKVIIFLKFYFKRQVVL